ncbi:hypothetical protein AK830_g6834 [Neonectria ditissima]|uniref:Uncharacterized protein n=1 Tax=Neonectria ditissima TaxID=78410 RepID=A0A0P7BFK1_9HYPO|nr:hypothetical protein AK830_g6834 [Neonectria ditissima]
MPPQSDQRWGCFRVITDLEEKESKLVDNDNEILSQTVGKIHGPGFFDTNGLPIGDWILTEVTARGTHLWDRAVFDAQGPLATKMQAVDFEPGANNGDDTFCLFAGYSAYDLGFVFAYPPKRNTNLGEVLYDDVVSTLQMKKSTGEVIVGENTILHHTLTIPTNFAAFKTLLITKNWQSAFSGGDIDGERAKSLAVQSWRSLQQGHEPVVIARVQPRLASGIPGNGMPSLTARENPNLAWATNNRVWEEVLPQVEPNMFGPRPSWTGFTHRVPYMSNLTYPPELYSKLTEFARHHPYDKFDAKAMLFAVQLWVDITDHPTLMAEDHTRSQTDVPIISLSVFLVYYEAWLKVHEYLQCSRYVHPFRVMKQMYLQDLAASSEVFAVKDNILEEAEMKALVLCCEAKHSLLPAIDRVEIFPFKMNGTAMAHPQDFREHPLSCPTEHALIGMADIRVLGLPSFHSQSTHKRLIAIPAPIARLSFHGNEINVQPEALSQCRNLAGPGPTSQLGTHHTFGNVWTHEFQPDVDLTGLPQKEFALMHDLDPNLPASHFIDPLMLDVWFQKMSQRLVWLEKLGVLNFKLTTGPDGLPVYEGMPLEEGEYLWPPISTAGHVAKALRDPRNNPLLAEPILTTQHLQKIINALEHRPVLKTHVAWQRALTELKEKPRQGGQMKALAVLKLLESARYSYMEDWGYLKTFLDMAKEDYRQVLDNRTPSTGWIAQYMCRIVGCEASPVPDAQWWLDQMSEEVDESHDTIIWTFIDAAFRNLSNAIHDHYSGEPERQAKAKQATERSVVWVEAFLEKEENGPLLGVIELEMEAIRNKVRKRGFGCRLS